MLKTKPDEYLLNWVYLISYWTTNFGIAILTKNWILKEAKKMIVELGWYVTKKVNVQKTWFEELKLYLPISREWKIRKNGPFQKFIIFTTPLSFNATQFH